MSPPADNRLDPRVEEVVNRPERLQALATLDVNAESSAEALDRLIRIACRTLSVPVALVNLIGRDRQMFLGCGPLPEPWSSMREMPITAGWCPYALLADEAFAFADARTDPELANNPAAQRHGVVAYAGVPLRTAGGESIGTLCALDFQPHDWTQDELELMADLAASAVDELHLLTASRLLERDHERLHALETVSCILAEAESADDVLRAVIDAVERTDAGALWRSDGTTLRAVAHAGEHAVPGPEQVALDAALPQAEVARAGEARFISSRSDVRDAFGDDGAGAGAVALLPLTAGEQRLGVLGASFRDERRFTTDDREYLAALAGISGLALSATAPRP